MPRIIYHLDFLLANPDIKILVRSWILDPRFLPCMSVAVPFTDCFLQYVCFHVCLDTYLNAFHMIRLSHIHLPSPFYLFKICDLLLQLVRNPSVNFIMMVTIHNLPPASLEILIFIFRLSDFWLIVILFQHTCIQRLFNLILIMCLKSAVTSS